MSESFYVVSNVWMGRAWHICETREQAAHNQYAEMRQRHGDEVRLDQFRAWPARDWPNLNNEEAFGWIVAQERAELMSNQDAERARILRHIEAVRNFMDACAIAIIRRGSEHDFSKFSEQEFDTYARVQPLLRSTEYGSDEYRDACRGLGPALTHHQKANRHHPEYFEDGVSGMNLIDLLEMFCDWKASSLRGGDPASIYKSIKICQERFGLSDDLVSVLENTARWISEQDVRHFAEES